jgi:hypothetical protein
MESLHDRPRPFLGQVTKVAAYFRESGPFIAYCAAVVAIAVYLRFLFPGSAVPYQDDIFFLAPETFEKGYWQSVLQMYRTTSGRLGEISFAVLWSRLMFWFSAGPWQDYWFSLKILPFVPITLAFGVFVQTVLKLTKGETLVAGALLWLGFWNFSLNDSIPWSMTFVMMLGNYTTPIFIYSIVMNRYLQQPADKKWNPLVVALLSFVYLHIAVTHEQLLVSTAILTPLFLSYPVLSSRVPLSSLVPRLGVWIVLQASAFAIFFLSPGQVKRAQVSGVDYSMNFTRFRISATETLCKLFSRHLDYADTLSRWVIAFALIGWLVALVTLFRNRLRIHSRPFGTFLFGLFFFSAGYASQSTFLVTAYFPDRAKIMPMLFLATGTVLLLGALGQWVLNRAAYFRAEVLTLFILLCVLSVPQGLRSYKRSMNLWAAWYTLDHGRMELYLKVKRILETTDKNIVFDHTSCALTTYEDPANMMRFWRWGGFPDRIEYLVTGKIVNPLGKPTLAGIVRCD